MTVQYLNKLQLKAEIEKCLQCRTKPCMHACPVLCSPCDFIAAARESDYKKAAELILTKNPLGEVCGLICPDKFCQSACVRKNLDNAIKISALQATIMKIARQNNVIDLLQTTHTNGKKIAVIGLGPAGIGAISKLLENGFQVTAFEKENNVGGALNLIPSQRLPKEVLNFEWQNIAKSPLLEVRFKQNLSDYHQLLSHGFDGIIVALGEQKNRRLGIEGEDLALDYTTYLKNPIKYQTDGHVAVIGGGAVAVDCAVTAARLGAKHVEMFVRRAIADMRISLQELNELLEHHIDISSMTRLTKIAKDNNWLSVDTIKTEFNNDNKLVDVVGSNINRSNIALVILALGGVRAEEIHEHEKIIYAGDFINGSSTAVEAIASGQKAAQLLEERLKSF